MNRFAALALVLTLTCAAPAGAQQQQQGVISVDGAVALSSLVAIADGHLQTVADSLETLAAGEAARSGQWERILPGLRQAAAVNVGGSFWYARADGTYWTIAGGKQQANVSDRPYFARVLTGKTSIGDLVLSRSSNRPVTVVAVPVFGKGGAVTGALGGSIYLDELSARVKREMGLEPGMLFWSIDAHARIALHSDATNIFVEPGTMSGELDRVTREMMSHESGTQSYTFRGAKRTILYRLSPLTGWRYGFGVLH